MKLRALLSAALDLAVCSLIGYFGLLASQNLYPYLGQALFGVSFLVGLRLVVSDLWRV